MAEISKETKDSSLYNLSQKIFHAYTSDVLADPDKEIWGDFSTEELDKSTVYITEILNSLSEEVAKRKEEPVSIHVDAMPEGNNKKV